MFQSLSTANTFSQWITETQRTVSVLNGLTDGAGSFIYYSNTNINLSDNLNIGGNLTVGGLVILDDIEYNDLDVAGNANIVKSIISSNGIFTNLEVTGNIFSLNTNTLSVGTNINVSSNLTVIDIFSTNNFQVVGDVTGTSNLFVPNLVVSSNIEFLNVTSDLYVGLNTNIYGDIFADLTDDSNILIDGDLNVGNVKVDELIVFSFIGTANTNIYNTIFATNAYTSVQNTLAEFATLSCILG